MTISEARSTANCRLQILDRYVESGGNFIDTAELYARWIPGGEHQSEIFIGGWLRERGLRDALNHFDQGRSSEAWNR